MIRDYSIRQKKILLIPEFSETGGAMTYAIELMRFYYDSGYKIVVCLPLSCQLKSMMDKIKLFNIECVTIHERWRGFKHFWRYSPFNYLLDFILIFKIYKKIKPDCIVVSNVCPESYLGLAILSTPFISIQHTYHLFFKPLNNSNFFVSNLFFKINNYCLQKIFNKRTKRIIAVSEFSKKQFLSSFFLPQENISVIYNYGLRKNPFLSVKSQNHKIQILTLAHVRAYKNPLVWIKVAEKVIKFLPEIDVEFIWCGDGELLEECKLIVNEINKNEKIKFIGFTKNTQVYYSLASIYFQPSLIESHGISVVEAMAYSLPCVVADMGGLPESVVNGINGYLVTPDNINEMSQAIIALINNEKLRKKMGENSLRIYNEKFSYDIWKQKMNDLHNNLFLFKNEF
jgi:glycosyltransferase involved in cell wall biosynthesis